MTEQEAIDMLKYRIKTATEIVGDNGAYNDLRMGIEALEKQIAKKPTPISGMCKCGKFLNRGNYCWNCGQKLDWN